MDLLKNALAEALARNAAETERWQRHRDDHRQAADNLELFRKSIEVDIMVPIGGKALIPGRLYHTNEIFVSHSSKMYSKCTAHQAIGVCQHRVAAAEQRLQELTTEQEMYQNKLELPAAEDAFRTDGEQEIIEEYDEAAEERWREQHRERVREQKQRERDEREQIVKTAAEPSTGRPAVGSGDDDLDVMTMLDELQLMEELEYELESMQTDGTDGDEQLQKLLTGELQVPGDRPRVAHAPQKSAPAGIVEPNPQVLVKSMSKPLRQLLDRAVDYTSRNSVRDIANGAEVLDSDDESDDDADDATSSSSADSDSDEDLPDQFKLYRLQAAQMSRTEQIRFYRTKLREVQHQLRSAKAVTSVEELVSKSDRMFVCDHLQSAIDRLRDGGVEENEKTRVAEAVAEPNASPTVPPKRSVSFGADEVASFSRHQAPRRVSDDLRRAEDEEEDGDFGGVGAGLGLTKSTSTELAKSILKNKDAVQQERHRSQMVQVPDDGDAKKAAGSEPLLEFNKIIGDIFEKIYPPIAVAATPAEPAQPDPLPGETFRNSHAPKQRISRFKASRQK